MLLPLLILMQEVLVWEQQYEMQLLATKWASIFLLNAAGAVLFFKLASYVSF